jgi:hypothetical protein
MAGGRLDHRRSWQPRTTGLQATVIDSGSTWTSDNVPIAVFAE